MKFKLIILCCILIGYNVVIQAASFAKTKEQELEEVVEYLYHQHPDCNKEALYNTILNYDTGPEFVPIIKIIWNPGETDDQARLAQSALAQDALDTFNQLKVMMNIPEEIELWVENIKNDTPIQYDALHRRVNIRPSFFSNTSPSARLFAFIHEFTHVQQHQRDGLLVMRKTATPSQKVVYEHEADIAAAQAISCPICLQIVEDECFLGESHNEKMNNLNHNSSQGYLSSTQLAEYKATKSFANICKAHAINNTANQQLQGLLPSQNSQTVIDWFFNKKEKNAEIRDKLDAQSSKFIQDRLSTVNFNR